MKSVLTILISLPFFFSSCGGDDFPEQSKLGGLRVLGIQADAPEINSAGTVNLTPLISFVDGGNTTLDFSWEACPDPGISFGAEVSCDGAESALKLSGSGTFNMTALAGSYYTGNASGVSLVIPSSVFVYLSNLDSDIQYNGLDFIFILTYTDQTSKESIQSLKKIKLSTKPGGELNTNPSFSNIQFEKTNLITYPTSSGSMSLSSPSAAETYSQITNVGTKSFSESPFISWYSSTGEFLFSRTDTNEDNSFDPKGSSGVFVAIYRDGRGGIATSVVSF